MLNKAFDRDDATIGYKLSTSNIGASGKTSRFTFIYGDVSLGGLAPGSRKRVHFHFGRYSRCKGYGVYPKGISR